MGPPDDNDGRRLTQPTPAMTPTAATTPKVAAILPGQVDAVAAEAAEAAEQLAYDWHIADEREFPPGLDHCPCSCTWCTGRWAS